MHLFLQAEGALSLECDLDPRGSGPQKVAAAAD